MLKFLFYNMLRILFTLEVFFFSKASASTYEHQSIFYACVVCRLSILYLLYYVCIVHMQGGVVFFDFLGLWLVQYPEWVGMLLNCVVIVVVLYSSVSRARHSYR